MSALKSFAKLQKKESPDEFGRNALSARTYFLSIGSNISPGENIPACLATLKKRYVVTRVSSIYETPPFGPCGKTNFWNLAIKFECALAHEELQRELSGIENLHGREPERIDKFAPRTIDLDLLPKTGYQKLAFVMVPLAEIAPEEKDPESGETFAELAKKLARQAEGFKKISVGWAG